MSHNNNKNKKVTSKPNFSLEHDIIAHTRMDGPLSSKSGGLQPRWQQKQKSAKKIDENEKCQQQQQNKSSLGASLNASASYTGPLRLNNSTNQFGNLNLSAGLTAGSKRLNDSLRKTPSKTPSKKAKSGGNDIAGGPRTPGRTSNNGTPGRPKTPGTGDRFIPNRSATDFELVNFRLTRGELMDPDPENSMSPSKRNFQRMMSENLTGNGNAGNGSESSNETRILSYSQKKPPDAPESHSNGLKVLFSKSSLPTTNSKKTARHISQAPDRILDAPDLQDDYYLNLIDWSANNHLAVALRSCIYLWNADNGDIKQLMELEGADELVCSVKFIKEGNCLAVGVSTGEVSLYDVELGRRVRAMDGHNDRVGAISWNEYILTSGSRSGLIHHSDVRIADHLVQSFQAHSQEVCGLAWSPDGQLLASGGNDNMCKIWPVVTGERFSEPTPKYTFTDHQSAVKAVSWCPWLSNVLATGGGTADRCIKFWNCNNGTLIKSVDTRSQVCALLWSPEYKELVSSHGYANHEVTIWKYPSMVKVAELLGHTQRVLHLSMSPDGSTIVSAGADETLRLWKCFEPDSSKAKRSKANTKKDSKLLTRTGIR